MSDAIRYATATITIATSTTISAVVIIPDGCTVIGLFPAATWDTQAISFRVSWDDATFAALYDGASSYSLAGCVASIYYALNPNLFLGARQLKVVSGAAQTSDTTLTVVFYKVV